MLKHQVVGESIQRLDGWEKVTGEACYADDFKLPGMIFGKVLRSKIPHAELLDIDISAAQRIPGVVTVLTAKDIPGRKKVGLMVKDEPVLAEGKIRRLGEPLCLVAAESLSIAEDALARMQVNIRELPPVFSPVKALEPDAPHVHEKGNILFHRKIRKGNIEEALVKAEIKIENTYTTASVEHASLEPECSVAWRRGESVTIWTTTQNPYYVRDEVAAVLGLDLNKVRVIPQTIGGGFGGKLDITTECYTALLAWFSGLPVKLSYTREESFQNTPKRHPSIIEYLTAADGEGRLLGVKVKIILDTGAYASYGPTVVSRAAVHATGPYDVPHVHIDAYGVYTNNPVCGAMRGFGVPQIGFAHETQMDILGEKARIGPWEVRRINFLTPGKATATAQILSQSLGIAKTLEAVREKVVERTGESKDAKQSSKC